MPVQTGTATDYKDLLSKLKDFVTTPNTLGAITPGGGNTGNGTVTGLAAIDAAVTETWTLTCTAGGATGTFSVAGSVSGAKADATVGTAYDNSIVAFTINDGVVDFIIGDSFTFTVIKVMGIEHWTTMRWSTNWDTFNGYELILKGPGSGDDEIFVGIQTFYNEVSAYYNWRLNGFTGYSAPAAWGSQPGAIPNDSNCYYPNVALWNTNIPYWFVANGRRIVMVAKLSTVYETCYLGFLLPYGLPNQLPYPLVVGGTMPSNLTTTDKRYSSTVFQHRAFVDPAGGAGAGSLCLLHGSWVNFRNWISETQPQGSLSYNNVWPFCHSDYNYTGQDPNMKYKLIQQNIDDGRPLFPLIVAEGTPNKNFFGELQGCYAIPGFGLSVEDTITIAGKTYLVVQNVFRTVTWAFWALLLE
jgi:hypothetical protein